VTRRVALTFAISLIAGCSVGAEPSNSNVDNLEVSFYDIHKVSAPYLACFDRRISAAHRKTASSFEDKSPDDQARIANELRDAAHNACHTPWQQGKSELYRRAAEANNLRGLADPRLTVDKFHNAAVRAWQTNVLVAYIMPALATQSGSSISQYRKFEQSVDSLEDYFRCFEAKIADKSDPTQLAGPPSLETAARFGQLIVDADKHCFSKGEAALKDAGFASGRIALRPVTLDEPDSFVLGMLVQFQQSAAQFHLQLALAKTKKNDAPNP
jgi:hypothetical protein